MWGEMCLTHGKLLIAMLTELRPGMSVKQVSKDKSPMLGRLAAHSVVKETMNDRSHPQKKAEWSGWGSDCPMERAGPS